LTIDYLSQVPNVKWEDVGGLEDVKKSILDTVQVNLLLIWMASTIALCSRFFQLLASKST
jgi:hypothetical protein